MLKNLISIEERRVSALILGFLFTLFYCAVVYAVRGKLDTAWVDILQAIIAGVVGVGGVNALRDWASNKAGEQGGDDRGGTG